ncbi:hypothetical protein [Nannocystis bainbridge]|uniref:Uncharacterized protein n=1 Tax=Nannocystis bainbridge TaxID=2995303 RepID=A0ABT5E6B8_9BACT|nr:hypothetical protein [Nannocystis bainbridge]MDC0721407.1 hypothetical protein [Nannocystis bainbridge]
MAPTSGAGEVTSSATTDTTAEDACVVVPSQDLCSAACEPLTDCCKCGGPLPLPSGRATCAIPTGIVGAFCPWPVESVRLDDVSLPQGVADCSDPNALWVQFHADGERIVELCGAACATYLAGTFASLEMEVGFCEAA